MAHFIFISLFLLFSFSPAYSWTVKVNGNSDGDTIKVLRDKEQVKIRLYGIDTPEKGQAFGNKAKKFTASLVAGKIVEIESITKDRYGRTVAIIQVSGKNVNEEIVRSGYAWVYRKYCKKSFCKDWYKLESEARIERRGIWTDKNAIPPWEWRRNRQMIG